jgi:hypothetical protein
MAGRAVAVTDTPLVILRRALQPFLAALLAFLAASMLTTVALA